MANYKETTLTGTTWMRCRAVTITNPLPGTEELDGRTQQPVGPTAYFQEEKVITMDGADMRSDAGSCCKAFATDGVIALRDPGTGELTGETTSHGALYTILFSLYMQTALERD